MKTECVDEMMMAEYMEGRLAEAEVQELESHLSGCDECLEELILAKRPLGDAHGAGADAAPAHATEAAVRLVHGQAPGPQDFPGDGLHGWIQRLGLGLLLGLFLGLFRGISRYLAPAFSGPMRPAAVRGDDGEISGGCVFLGKNFGRIKTKIEIEKTREDRALIRVWATENGRAPRNVRVTLKRGEREVRSLLLNQGYVLMEEIPFGCYGLEFMDNGGALGVHALEILGDRR